MMAFWKRLSGYGLLLGLLLILGSTQVMAQAVWTEVPRGHVVKAEGYWPTGPVIQGHDAPIGAFFLLGQVQIKGVDFRAELPIVTGGPETRHETVIGNLYLGVAYPPPFTEGMLAEIGLRLPTTPEKADVAPAHRIGTFADHSRGATFAPDLLTFSAAATYVRRFDYGFSGRVHGRPMLALDTSGKEKLALHFVHLLHLYYTREWVRAGVGVGGTFIATDVPDDTLAKRTAYELGFSLDANLGRFRPGLLLRIPLENTLDDNLEVVYGASVTVGW